MKLLKKYNILLLVIPILLFSLGYLTLFSTSPERARDQLIFFIGGYLLYLLVSLIDFQLYKYLYFLSLGLLIFTYVYGEIVYGSARWINFGFFSLQPSELAKVALVITLSSLIAASDKSLSNAKSLLMMCGVFVPLMALVFIQPDLGTSIILISVFVFTLFYAGLNKWFFATLFVFLGLFSSPLWHLLKDYQKQRILVFMNPALDVLGSGYNVIQAQIAVGSGGLFGKGFGHGTQSQLNFLPAHWTDFAFASFAEEWGFIGVFLMVALYLILLFAVLHIVYKTKDSYGALLGFGVFVVFFVQFLINVGMNLGVMPVTGIPLPFISYGGSSLLVSFLLLGLVQSVIIYSHAEFNRFS